VNGESADLVGVGDDRVKDFIGEGAEEDGVVPRCDVDRARVVVDQTNDDVFVFDLNDLRRGQERIQLTLTLTSIT
jgi:uncharacterized protein YgbK (DUF1537 family)